MSAQKQRKRVTLACTYCRSRKVKCNVHETLPCYNCYKDGQECVVLPTDKRKDRYRIKYLEELESKVAQYEKLIKQVRGNLDATTRLLDPDTTGVLEDPTSREASSSAQPILPTIQGKYLQANNFANDENLSVAVYGPTSVFDTEKIQAEASKVASLNSDPVLVDCIKLFFKWQYPDMHLFVFREAFLLDFFSPKSNGVYSSAELVYAICAMGALVSEDPHINKRAGEFYTTARESLMKLTDYPTISSLQAYLLLGLYDVYNGKINSGWILSGDGFRVGFGIGFHLSPENWLVKQDEEVSDITISVRSRIFWGSFMVDRFLSLILGRPWTLKTDDSTISGSINMPAIDWIDDYTYPGTASCKAPLYIDVSNPLKNMIDLVAISDEMLLRVFPSKRAKEQRGMRQRILLLEEYNKKIANWRQNLPPIMQWDTEDLAKHGHDHTKMFMRFFYYIVLLCLNRPFIEETRGFKDSQNAMKVCEVVIKDLHTAIRSFVGSHGFQRCSFLILYSCIMCVSIILLSSSGGGLIQDVSLEDYFFEFMTVLKLSSKTWKLSERSYNKVRLTLKNEYKVSYHDLFSRFLEKKQTLDDGFLVQGNSIISMINTEDLDPPTDLPSSGWEASYANLEELAGLGGPPVFTTTENNDWSSLFSSYESLYQD